MKKIEVPDQLLEPDTPTLILLQQLPSIQTFQEVSQHISRLFM